MEKIKINNELMSRFYTGNVSAEEFQMILLAAEHDPDLKEEIRIISSISDKLLDIRIEKKTCCESCQYDVSAFAYLCPCSTK